MNNKKRISKKIIKLKNKRFCFIIDVAKIPDDLPPKEILKYFYENKLEFVKK